MDDPLGIALIIVIGLIFFGCFRWKPGPPSEHVIYALQSGWVSGEKLQQQDDEAIREVRSAPFQATGCALVAIVILFLLAGLLSQIDGVQNLVNGPVTDAINSARSVNGVPPLP